MEIVYAPQFIQVEDPYQQYIDVDNPNPNAHRCIPIQLVCGEKCHPYDNNRGPVLHTVAQEAKCAGDQAVPGTFSPNGNENNLYNGVADDRSTIYHWVKEDLPHENTSCTLGDSLLGRGMSSWRYVVKNE